MSDVVAVLVVPAEGDPGGLLAQGLFASGPPAVVARCGCGQWGHHGCARLATEPWEMLLPLWWDGQIVPEGMDRARRVLRNTKMPHEHRWHALQFEPDLSAAAHMELDGEALVRLGLASRVVRLTRVDGRLVEVEVTP